MTRSAASYRIERVRRAGWERYRELRLQMLQDSPVAYLETYQEALAHPEVEWRFRVGRMAGPGQLGVVAVAPDGDWIGVMGGLATEPGTAVLVGVWLHPEHRGRGRAGSGAGAGAEGGYGDGVADRLLNEVIDWARTEVGAVRILLEVHETNARAAAFYERRGFVRTGVTRPYLLDPSTLEVEMALGL
ncbi:GNAT family N-acetyltransferase [Kitasatospora sp. MAP5-34]|uniref:GNAT family N-acetyltransferase n=1 Tax=Kitasatospora sp. MAP5-34 TaxID=3035102 RepID=UPI002476850D|nr:GNAT family N-acetyltransferase [Kitasatospora sp. MAP5-34]